MREKLIRVGFRFLKGWVAAFVPAFGLLAKPLLEQPEIPLSVLLVSLAHAAGFAAISGFLLALEKWVNWQEVEIPA